MKKIILLVIVAILFSLWSQANSLDFSLESSLKVKYLLEYEILTTRYFISFDDDDNIYKYPEVYYKEILETSLICQEQFELNLKLSFTDNIYLSVNTSMYVYNYYKEWNSWVPFEAGFSINPNISLFGFEFGFYHECRHAVRPTSVRYSPMIDISKEYLYLSFNNNSSTDPGILYDIQYHGILNDEGMSYTNSIRITSVFEDLHTFYLDLGYRTFFGLEFGGIVSKKFSKDFSISHREDLQFYTRFKFKCFEVGWEYNIFYIDNPKLTYRPHRFDYKESYIYFKIKNF